MRSLRTSEAAERAGVSPSTLQKWAQRGLVPFDRTAGGHRRFDPGEVITAARGRRPVPDLSTLRTKATRIERILRTHGMGGARVIGSVARGTQGPDSDVDLVVDVEPGRTLLDMVAATFDLEDELMASVDLIDARAATVSMDDALDEAVTL
jgi:hypothetical protein